MGKAIKKLIELDAAIAETWKDTGYSDPLNVMTAIRERKVLCNKRVCGDYRQQREQSRWY